ncbi:MAG: hypothetical protein Q9191_000642 [Dirinaria sp. TL-2023a]
MATNRSLTTLIRALQIESNEQDVPRLLGSATTLLTLLSNHLNITLLTAQLLSAPALWRNPNGVETTIQILSIFNSASVHLLSGKASRPALESPAITDLTAEKWVTAVIKGADERSPRWRHLLVFGGLLLGFSKHDGHALSDQLRRVLENATVTATNLALQQGEASDNLAAKSIAVVLSHVFELLNDTERLSLDHNSLLPILYQPPLFDKDGLHFGYFLSNIDADVIEAIQGKFDWAAGSSTYVQTKRMSTGPLFSSLGSLSRLIAFAAENAQDPAAVVTLVGDLSHFARSLCVQWRQNKLSEIDISEELVYLTENALKTTLPLLWRVLKSSMFATIMILRSVLGRVLGDVRLPMDTGSSPNSWLIRMLTSTAPFVAVQILHILRNFYFISSRAGASSFSEYTFVYLTAIDILSNSPVQVEAFLQDIKPSEIGIIPQHPLDRCHDLFFLNTSEHFALVLNPRLCEDLLVTAAMPYLGLDKDRRLLENFEAAHSVMLAVFAAPMNTEITIRHINAYYDVLFKAFPQNISARQFRMAVKTLVRITAPPSPISEVQPLLPSTLLELVYSRLAAAPTQPLPQANILDESKPHGNEQVVLSERAILILALVDSLPYLPPPELVDWLPIVAQSLQSVQNDSMLQSCRHRLWEVMTNGEMDVDRAAVCAAWWGTRGGKQMVLEDSIVSEKGPFMSGALDETSKL